MKELIVARVCFCEMMAIKIRGAGNLFWRMQCPNKLLGSLLLRMKYYFMLRIFIIHRLEYWIVFDGVYELFYTSSHLFWLGFRIDLGASILLASVLNNLVLQNLILRTETMLCRNYSLKSEANLKIYLVKMSQKLIFSVINYFFHISYTLFL